MNSAFCDSEQRVKGADNLLSHNMSIGIDFGTSNTFMAISNKTKVDILQNDRGNIVTPSIVAFDGDRILIGDETTASSIKPENIIWGMKRSLGCSCEELKEKNYGNQSFAISYDQKKPRILVPFQGKLLHFEQIVAILFSKLKAGIEEKYGVLGQAVLTVPSSFEPFQCRALKDSAVMAEIPVLHLIEETTAAAIAFAYRKMVEKSRYILIFHLGGGFFNVAIYCIGGHCIELLSSVASSDIGGMNFTELIMDYVFDNTTHSFAKYQSKTLMHISAACERAKQELSELEKTKIKTEMKELQYSRRLFERKNKDLLNIIDWAIKLALCIAYLSNEEIDNYFVIGKSTMMPCILKILNNHFDESKKKNITNADDAAVCGAAILAEYLTGQSEMDLHVFSNVNTGKISIGNGEVSSDCDKVFAVSSLRNGLIDDMKQLASFDHKLNLEFTIRAQAAIRFSNKNLNKKYFTTTVFREESHKAEHDTKTIGSLNCKYNIFESGGLSKMAEEVKMCLKSDEKWLALDKRKTILSKDIHKTEYRIKELLGQVIGIGYNYRAVGAIRALQKKCEELSEQICLVEIFSLNDLEKAENTIEEIRKDLDEWESNVQAPHNSTRWNLGLGYWMTYLIMIVGIVQLLHVLLSQKDKH